MSETPVEFWGKLYQGKSQRDLKNMEFSIEDLKAMGDLKGKPIWLEHNAQTGDIGIIHRSWVDTSGWLWIHGELYGPDKIGELHHEIRAKLVNGELPDLSIHWIGQADASTDIVDPGTKAVIEASLTTEGFFKGTTLYSVAAHADNKTKTLHVQQAGQRLLLHPPTMSQDLQAIFEDAQKRHGVTLSEEELRLSAADPTGVKGALLTLNKLNEAAEMKDNELTTKEREIMQKARMQESDREEFEKLKAWKAEAEKQYAAEQGKVAEQLSEAAKSLPEAEQESMKEHLNLLASKSDYLPTWKVVKFFGESAAENERLATNYAKQIARAKKEYNDLLKERDALMTNHQQALTEKVEVSQAASAKRGIDKDAEANKRAKPDPEQATSKPVEMAASREASVANFFFSKAIGTGTSKDEFGAALDKLVAEQPLTVGALPPMDWSHYRGYNQAPTPNRDGIIPFGATH